MPGLSPSMLTSLAKPTHGPQPLWQVSLCLFIAVGKIHSEFQLMKDRVEVKIEVTRR